jgi:hypothetical protein
MFLAAQGSKINQCNSGTLAFPLSHTPSYLVFAFQSLVLLRIAPLNERCLFSHFPGLTLSRGLEDILTRLSVRPIYNDGRAVH